ncbi:hypothetical protein [Burkholderia latens]|uniref:hypothetical protein n=1 Tax=Burkholderia latens TaxID=488446 RepID=UPI001589D786|nr:hypothetical protein [Burkholderia latens]
MHHNAFGARHALIHTVEIEIGGLLVAAIAELAARDVEAILQGEHNCQTAAEILIAA